MKHLGRYFTVALLLCAAFVTLSFTGKKTAASNPATSGPLYDEIAHADSALFSAFNTRDLERLKQFLDAGLELYQDNIGVRNYDETVKAFGELFKKDYVLTRTLVKGTMEVYPIKNYGAIQTGLHTFSHIENGQPQAATFKFMQIWQKKNGTWRITRLITYDH